MVGRIFPGSAITILVIVLTACGAVDKGAVGDTRTVARATHSGPVLGHDVFAMMRSQSTDLGPLAARSRVALILLLKNPNAAREAADIKAMYTPGSPSFGKYKSRAQVAADYGPRPSMVEKVNTWLRHAGLSPTWHRGDAWMQVTGPVRMVERAFGVRIHAYRSSRHIPYYASTRDATVPVGIRGPVTAVGRISSYLPPWRHRPGRAIPLDGLSPTDLVKAYDITPLRDLGMDGAGETVSFFEVDGFDQKNFDTYTAKYNLPPMHVDVTGPVLKAGEETEMDLEIVHAIAPKARLHVYNIDTQAAIKQVSTLAEYADKFVFKMHSQMVSDNPHGIISISWGGCDQIWGANLVNAWKDIYDRADAQGVSTFVSTGDSGAYECINAAKQDTPPSPDLVGVAVPASLPGVTAVGGTRLSLRKDSSWYGETVWEWPPVVGGTGGGFSAFIPRPTWQTGPGVANSANSKNMRSVPDVSADADPASGAAIFSVGDWTKGGGTSQSAPIWAGIAALMNQYFKSKGLHEVGFLNPALYALYNSTPEFPAFHDVTNGSNLVYPAGPGYDMATGIGTPDVWNLTRDLEAYFKNGSKRVKKP